MSPSGVAEFERHYGPAGTWARLFARSEGFIETVLLRDADDSLRYVTIDRWRSAAHLSAFRIRFATEYRELDADCEALTTEERNLGSFVEIA